MRRSDDFLHLCAEHRFVGARNGAMARARALAAHARCPFFPESATIRVEAEHSSASAAEQAAERFRGMRSTVHLMLEAPVMLILNRIWDRQTVPLGLMNGARGTVKAIVYREGERPCAEHQPEYVVVAFPDYRGAPFFPGTGREQWVPVPPVKQGLEGRESVWRRQVPLRLCWAVTLLKAQGLTVKEGVLVDFALRWHQELGRHLWRAFRGLDALRELRQLGLSRAAGP